MNQHHVPQQSTTAHSPYKLAHIVLRSRDRYDEMVAWYKTVLNATPVHESARLTFLAYDDEHHRVAIARVPDLADRPHRVIGVDHIAFTYPTLLQLLETYERLQQAGIDPILAVNHGPTMSMYFVDPDGTRIELQIDNFDGDMAEAIERMKGQFGVNDVGVEFDPQDMLNQLRAGADAADFLRPAAFDEPPTDALLKKLRSC